MSSNKQDLLYQRQLESYKRRDNSQNNREYIGSLEEQEESCSEQEQSYVPSDMMSNIFDSRKSLKETAGAARAETSLGAYLSSYTTSDGFKVNEASKIMSNDHLMTHDKRDISKENKSRNDYISNKDGNLNDKRISGNYQISQLIPQTINNPSNINVNYVINDVDQRNSQLLSNITSKSQPIPDTILEEIASDLMKNQAYLQNSVEIAQLDGSSKDRLYLYESILEEGSLSSKNNEKIGQAGEQSCYSHFRDAESSLDRLSLADIGGKQSRRTMSQLGEHNDGNVKNGIKDILRDRKCLNQGESLEKQSNQRITRNQRDEDEAKMLDKDLRELEDELKQVGEQINKADSYVNKLEIKRRKLRQKHQQLGFTPEALRNQATALHALRDREEKNTFIINELKRCNEELAKQLLEIQNEHQTQKEQQKSVLR